MVPQHITLIPSNQVNIFTYIYRKSRFKSEIVFDYLYYAIFNLKLQFNPKIFHLIVNIVNSKSSNLHHTVNRCFTAVWVSQGAVVENK